MTKETSARQNSVINTDADTSASTQAISADQVAQYLSQHPDFFVNRDTLLADITLPHESGQAISLLERQVKILRDRSIDARHTLSVLVENAKYNDQLFSVTRALILALLAEDDIAQIASATEANLCTQPGIDACSVILFDSSDLRNINNARIEPRDNLEASFPELFRSRRTLCQVVDKDLAKTLFPKTNANIRSVAICPIGRNNMLGVLAIGNKSQDYFNPDLETLFLDFIGEVLESLLIRHLA
ncbi:MAG: DUF484 family protein [Pseudohongiellaceae bacterium]|nr:DUF484 family protein [Pseudohongiellaceae bacterium]